MKKKWIGILIVVLIIVLQFVPVDRSNPPVSADIQAPPAVKEVLRSGCYDTHSNETYWPWYGYVAPVSWMIVHDVREARDELNFSDWGLIHEGNRSATAERIWKKVEDGEMPLLMYRLIHPEARLSEDQKKILQDWSLSNTY